jgi:MFS family permease
MSNDSKDILSPKILITFVAFTLFYCFEFGQMSYFNALAPKLLHTGLYTHDQLGSLSAIYYYGNVLGLLPAGYILDHLPLRRAFLFAILGSALGALTLALTDHYSIALTARFCCGFFGGTFSFVGGLRLLMNLFSKRFSLFMGIFLTAGMFGGMICQYPILWISDHYSPHAAILMMFYAGALVLIFNVFGLHPHHTPTTVDKSPRANGKAILQILKNYRNWTDCLLIIFVDSPFTILGTLWGVVTLSKLYHFTSGASALIMSAMFAGSIVGSILFGVLSDKYKHDTSLVAAGTGGMFLLFMLSVHITQTSIISVAIIFTLIGVLTGSQTIVFTWLTKNMRPELIGRNCAMNSMLFMGVGGLIKQFCAALLVLPSFMLNKSSTVNLLLFIGTMMLLAMIYVVIRKKLSADLSGE